MILMTLTHEHVNKILSTADRLLRGCKWYLYYWLRYHPRPDYFHPLLRSLCPAHGSPAASAGGLGSPEPLPQVEI